jgi:Zn-dependent protease with chaperone function
VFRPTLYAVLVVVALLLVVHGLLAGFGTVLLGELLGSSDPSLGVLVALLGLGMSAVTIRLARKLDVPVRLTIVGTELNLVEQPKVAALLQEVSSETGGPMPDQVVVGLVPDICLTGAEVDCLDGVFGGRTLYLSLSLCRILTPAELRGVLAHEFARLAGDGGSLAVDFYPAYSGVVRRHAVLARQRGFLRKVMVGPALQVSGLLFDAMADGEANAAASRDLDADKAAARVAGVDAYAAALIKLHAFDGAWDLVDEAMEQAVAFGIAWTNASALFAEVAVDNAGADRLKGLSDRVRAHPTERHLPLARRLAALGVDPARVAGAALDTAVSPSALSLIAGAEAMEQDLSGALQTIKARHHDVGYPVE